MYLFVSILENLIMDWIEDQSHLFRYVKLGYSKYYE